MNRNLGVWGVVVTLVGYVIGASIFILPGELAGTVGPAVVVSYALAAVVAAFACVASAQLGAVFPKTGAGYVTVRELVSPLAGFMGIWLMLGAFIMAIALIAIGFADYFVALFPSFNATFVAYGVVILFALLNMGRMQLLVGVQSFLVVFFMLALVAVAGGGVVQMEPANLTPFAPMGWHPVLIAVVPAFFSYGGFMAVMEMAGEIKDPARTMPRALIISFVLVVCTYVALALALTGMVPWQDLAMMKAPVKVLAEKLYAHWGGGLISLAVLGAAATSINALMLVASRDVVALARAGVLPKILAPAQGSDALPVVSVLLVGALAVVALALGQTVTEYAVWVASFNLLFQVFVAIALLKLIPNARALYDKSEFKLGERGVVFAGWGLLVISAGFFILMLSDALEKTFAVVLYVALGLVIYMRAGKKGG